MRGLEAMMHINQTLFSNQVLSTCVQILWYRATILLRSRLVQQDVLPSLTPVITYLQRRNRQPL